MKIWLVSDCHGNIEGLLRALRKKNLIDDSGKRLESGDNKIYSIGDLANCVEDSLRGDLACLDLVGDVLDGMIMGNHEMPYFDNGNTFWGFQYFPEIQDELEKLLEGDLLGSSVQFGDALITHAGITLQLCPKGSPSFVHNLLEEHFYAKDWNYSLFSSVGAERGGRSPVGGILWCDFDREFVPTPFPQIMGHTPKYVRMKENALCIDVGSKNPEIEPFILELT